jgi:hypothetical protein
MVKHPFIRQVMEVLWKTRTGEQEHVHPTSKTGLSFTPEVSLPIIDHNARSRASMRLCYFSCFTNGGLTTVLNAYLFRPIVKV